VIGVAVAEVRSIVNLHVPRGFHCDRSEWVLDDFVKRRSLARPFVGLLTGALTEHAAR
jgi:adenosylcobinamide amidohydrolase